MSMSDTRNEGREGRTQLYDYEGREFIPGLNCVDCGRFVGTDGSTRATYFEMSSEIAYVEGICARCLHPRGEA